MVGYKYNNIYVVVQLYSYEIQLKHLPQHLNGLHIIGTINIPNPNYELQLSIKDKLPYFLTETKDSFIIVFEPPNFRNLEYFSIDAILLQSTGKESVNPKKKELIEKLEIVEPLAGKKSDPSSSFISDDVILEKINLVLKDRLDLKVWNKEPGDIVNVSKYFNSIMHSCLGPIIFLVKSLQTIIIFFIKLINYEIYSYSLVTISQVFRQLDLRLQQLNYFPIQFLCYQNKNLLYGESKLLYELKLPIFNANLNINNSNYINLFNSLWLIFNDIVFGITMYKLIFENYDIILRTLNEDFIKKYLFSEVLDIISWISVNHPAGFKLNIELGQFMGDLFGWTLKFWKFLVYDAIQNLSPRFRHQLFYIINLLLKILCYTGGLSFLLGFFMDMINILTIHIYCFYYTSTKIYKRQLDIIKSLFQLFRGKKYNVLRNRIDNLNNYEDDVSSFEIDQFLLGTLLFMILILLLPTVFAFYLMFFTIQLCVLISKNFLENVQILANFTPMFVLLLKLKNSNRLQGGITFKFLEIKNYTCYLKLSNLSLSYGEILVNFIKLFTDSKTFRDSLIQFFLQGELISIKHNYVMKFHYLMLPEVYDKTVNIWQYL
ncbi:glycosylphosphatidylinositol synthesis N-acetylglucosaminyltransferase complex, subunit PIG-Q/GPI1 [Scheffersomyces amazonensis]|uniref:glycosylphosphatidylinositol synthesis N-acetylglucosaminyltransferase complex, subunit PIG-Q/GPI1 n=1 Tax=Scheffersomyces amazonensis TaxID=1078765 RepID=UPI00315CCA56